MWVRKDGFGSGARKGVRRRQPKGMVGKTLLGAWKTQVSAQRRPPPATSQGLGDRAVKITVPTAL